MTDLKMSPLFIFKKEIMSCNLKRNAKVSKLVKDDIYLFSLANLPMEKLYATINTEMWHNMCFVAHTLAVIISLQILKA